MPISVTHATVAVGADAGNGEIRKAQWNEEHVISGVPEIFAQSTVAQTVGATTTDTVLATISFAGGEIGPNGHIYVFTQWTTNNSANNKNLRIRVGGAAGTAMMEFTNTTHVGAARLTVISNDNSQSAQKCKMPAANAIGFGQYTSAGTTASVNTAAAWDLVISGNKANSGDTLTLESYSVIVCYGA